MRPIRDRWTRFIRNAYDDVTRERIPDKIRELVEMLHRLG